MKLKTLFSALCLVSLSFVQSSAFALEKPKNSVIKMSTTTSTENSGLLKFLLPKFEEKTGYSVQVIAVGSGKALKMGEDGDVDVVLSHAPAAEKEFVEKGFGDKRYPVMYNDFVVLGPEADPAGIKELKSTAESFAKIAETKSPFISRGDDSGTHKKELKIWETAKIKPEGEWYREAGDGMEKVIQMSGELNAYTLADRGTWLAVMNKSPLKILHEGDKELFNPYGIMAVSQKRYPDINHDGAQALIDWMVSEEGQAAIASFKVNDMVLFTPNADKADASAKETPAKVQ
ncbi:substrate-binding domain-containing protein [Thiolinea disciformis]|uniref:substrate-binding domain-containing protein n=1 Tax=Thiolinea disciformis TaxID=125614 RepID=UPI00036C66F7|nr:substrate-binding domain-containing protein [Thiolinea disciformis]